MSIQSAAEVWVEFHTSANGGRNNAAYLGDGLYRPHFRVAGGDYLGVTFVSSPKTLVQPGESTSAIVSFIYEPRVDYSALTAGVKFEVLEGAKVVATGHVIKRISVPNEVSHLEDESERASEMLKGKVVARMIRHRSTEVLLEFTDGTRLFVDQKADVLELSISGGR